MKESATAQVCGGNTTNQSIIYQPIKYDEMNVLNTMLSDDNEA